MMSAPWGLQASVNREARTINGMSVISKGEALGHNLWIDQDFLGQVVSAGAAAPRGIKCRFTHPGLCADGLGKYLGRIRNFRRENGQVRADLHISDTTQKAPEFENDPGEYILDLAEKDPEAFGASIVFSQDYSEQDRFIAQHEDEDGNFHSPDRGNTENLIHARLAKLHECDLVDSPAANPDGFFSSGDETAARAEQALAWLARLPGAHAPGPEVLGRAEPERIREFFDGFMARHGLEIVAVVEPDTEEEIMSKSVDACTLQAEGSWTYCVCNDCGYSEDHVAGSPCAEKTCPECGKPLTGSNEQPAKPEPAPAAPTEPTGQSRGAWQKLRDTFPEDKAFAIECFDKGISLAQAQATFLGVIQNRIKDRDAELQKLRDENASIRQKLLSGEDKPVPPSGEIKGAGGESFLGIVRAYQATKECSFADAVKMCRMTHPKEFKATRDAGLV